MSTFIDIHVLQSIPPSNVNRDDTGAPKSAVYGGVRRARVSSQAWKKATRDRFEVDLERRDMGYRTKQAASLIADRIHALRPELSVEERAGRAGAVLKALGFKPEPKRASKAEDPYDSSQYLTFFSADQLDQLAQLAVDEDKPTKPQAKVAADTNHGVALSLFGRMVADDASLNVDASVQVAHALSTHAVDTEADYYTAVDDVSEEAEESGAGMIGTIEFNSSTLYRYATVNVMQLLENTGDVEAAARAATAFVRSFVTSMPTGKQNTFANQTRPEAVVVMVRDDVPVNLVGAFEVPVTTRSGGYVQASAQALAKHSRELDEAYGTPPRSTHVLHVGDGTAAIAELGHKTDLAGLVQVADDTVRGAAGDGESA